MRSLAITFPASVRVTEQTIDLSGFSQRARDFYAELFREFVDIYDAGKKPRVVIGIAGPTGAGKSVVAVLFKEIATRAGLPFALESVTIDAYHYPNQYLLSHFSDGEPLKKVKGRFDTYDVRALARDLAAFSAGQNVSFPMYSRKLHDPIKDGVVIKAREALLIVEGLWLLYDQSGWEAIRPLLDYAFFIDSDKELAKAPVLKRHMTGGRTLEEASRHYQDVDGKNSDLVLTTKNKADQVIPPYYSL
jgi:pantothenate kinase